MGTKVKLPVSRTIPRIGISRRTLWKSSSQLRAEEAQALFWGRLTIRRESFYSLQHRSAQIDAAEKFSTLLPEWFQQGFGE